VRSTRIRQIAIGCCVLCALVVASYSSSIATVRHIGLNGLSLIRRGNCSWSVRVWQEAVCTQSALTRPEPSYAASMQLVPWSRQLHFASRMWSVVDSTSWQARVDSVRRAMRVAHYLRIGCDPSDTDFVTGEAWRAGGREIRLYAGPSSGPRTPHTRWYVGVLLVSHERPGCGLPPVRAANPVNASQSLQEWIASQFGEHMR
jgi:hypothetical protein